MKIGRKRKGNAEIPTSSMSDIAFLLIVFFMSTTKFDVKEGIRIVLPQATDESSQKTRFLRLPKRDDTYADYEEGLIGEQRNPRRLAEVDVLIHKKQR